MGSSFTSETDFGAREAFLRAIECHWTPKPLAELADATKQILPWISTFPETEPSPTEVGNRFKAFFFNATRSRIRWANLVADESHRGVGARLALETWRRSWTDRAAESLDGWVLDAALHSVAWARMTQRSHPEWAYSPEIQLRPQIEFAARAIDARELINQARRAGHEHDRLLKGTP